MKTTITKISDLIEILETFRNRYGDEATVAQIGYEDNTIPVSRAQIFGSDMELDGSGEWYGIDQPTLLLW